MSDGSIPTGLRPPVQLMLARAVESIPAEGALPGGCRYEPKWDGWRGATVVAAGGVSLWSRQGKELSAGFPDLIDAIRSQVTPGTVLDGELVAWGQDGLDFGALQQRLSTRLPARLAALPPAHLVVFDVLAADGADLRNLPFVERRTRLEVMASVWAPPLTLTPQTSDRDVAVDWFEHMGAAGIEGIVTKGAGQRYEPGRRGWLKVKRRTELDVICAAVLGPLTVPRVVVAGLPLDGRLRIVGRSVTLTQAASRSLGQVLTVPSVPHPWPAVVSASTVHGFGATREPVTLTLVEPLVVEVAADAAWSGRSFRHPLRYLRPRPDLDPADVVVPAHLGGSQA